MIVRFLTAKHDFCVEVHLVNDMYSRRQYALSQSYLAISEIAAWMAAVHITSI